MVAPDSSHILELVRVIGPGVLPADFTYLGPAGISANGKVALRSHTDCRIAIVDLASGGLERVFGRCGDGPHESRAIVALLWSGDTVIVVDASSGRFRWFGAADTAVRSVHPDAGALGGSSGLHSVAMVDDTTALLFLRLQPAGVVGAGQHGLVGDGASFRWGRLPRPVACGNEAIVSLIVPIEGNSAEPASGRIVALDWEGRTLLNQAIPGAAYPLAFAGWHGRDSLFVAAVSQATTPHAAVFRLRPRLAGEIGPFLIPDSVRATY